MKAKTKAIFFLHFLLILGVRVHGAEQTKELLTWKSCLKKTLEVHPKVKASELTYKAYLDQEISAQSGYFPQIKGQVSIGKSFNELSTDQTAQSASGSLVLTQNLFSGFLDVQKAKEAQTRSKIAFLDWEDTKKEVILDLKKTYVEWVNQYKLNDFANRTWERRKENLNIVRLRYSSGRENKGAVVLSEAYYQESVYDQKNSEKNLLNTQGKILSQFLFETANSEAFTERILFLPEKITRQSQPLKNSELPDKVLKTVDYLKAILSEELLDSLRLKAQSNFYPSLDLAGSWGYFDEQFPLNRQKWNVGLTLTIPLFTGGKNTSDYKAALKNFNAQSLIKKNAYQEALSNLRQANLNFTLSLEKYKVDQKFAEAASLRAEIAKQKYNNGLMTFEDWDKIESELIQREKTVLSSEKEILLNEANLEYLLTAEESQ